MVFALSRADRESTSRSRQYARKNKKSSAAINMIYRAELILI